MRVAIGRVASVITVLAGHGVPLTDSLIADAYACLVASGVEGPISKEEGECLVTSVTGVDPAPL